MRWKSEERERRERLAAIRARGYAERRLRPFCRRFLMTNLPARVLMRLRKPWVLLRLRVLG